MTKMRSDALTGGLKFMRRTGAARFSRGAAAFFVVLALVSTGFPTGAVGAQKRAESAAASKRLSEEERIVHVLNRLGFGARPGDVERVRRIGVERYIEQQLHPQSIDDEAAEAKLRSLPTLAMSTSELLAKYPNPGQLVRRLQRRGELPADLAALRNPRADANQSQRKPNAANVAGAKSSPGAGAAMDANAPAGSMSMPADSAMRARGTAAMPSPEGEEGRAGDNPERREYRRVVLEYMRENGLQPPQRILSELQSARIVRAVYSERQLQEVMVDFWTNHFNVFAGKGADRWLLTAYDRDTIRPHALGKFRDLLQATAKSPAMLFYLDNFQSVSPDAPRAGRRALAGIGGGGMRRRRMREGDDARPRRNRGAIERRSNGDDAAMMREDDAGEMAREQQRRPPQQRRRRGINENYARELMELHTLGVDGGYTQKDVQEVARAFTGWTIADPRGALGLDNSGQFVFNRRLHDDGEKLVLGQKIPAGGGLRDGEIVLDILARHPSTARFIATKLARRFVTDSPGHALVERVAAAYTKSDGDIAATLGALFASPEFNSAEARRAKIKTPFELAASAIRTLGGETNGSPQLHQWIARMGEPLYMYQAPTGYPDTSEHWVNQGLFVERLNFVLALAANRIAGTRVNLARFTGETGDGRGVAQERVVDRFLELILQGDVSPRTRATLMKQLNDQSITPATAATATASNETASNEMPSNERAASERGASEQLMTQREMRQARRAAREETAATGNTEVARIAALILGTPEFQRQ